MCVCKLCGQVVCGQAAGGEAGGEAGVHNQKQEPHTKMWGNTDVFGVSEAKQHAIYIGSRGF